MFSLKDLDLQTCFVALQPLVCLHILRGKAVHDSLVLLGVPFQLLQSGPQLSLPPFVLLVCFIELTNIWKSEDHHMHDLTIILNAGNKKNRNKKCSCLLVYVIAHFLLFFSAGPH